MTLSKVTLPFRITVPQFVYQLFLEKWGLYGRTLHLIKRFVDLLVISLTLAFSLSIKYEPIVSETHRGLCVAILIIIGIQVEEEARACYLYAMNEQGHDLDKLSALHLLKLTVRNMLCHSVHLQLIGQAFIVLGCIMTIAIDFPHPDTFYFASVSQVNGTMITDTGGVLSNTLTNSVARRMLKARPNGAAALESLEDTSFDFVGEGMAWNLLWLFLAMGEMFLMSHFAKVAFTPWPQVHLLLVSIAKVLSGDIMVFGVVYTWMSITFFSVLFTIYPRSGEYSLEVFSDMNGFITSAVSIVELSLVGEPLMINENFLKHPEVFNAMTFGQGFNLVFFVLIYLLFIILSIILLLNLLIALLTYTFDGVRESSLLTSRLYFAQNLMRLELIAAKLKMRTRCGEIQPDGKFVYSFRSVEVRHKFGDDYEDGYAGDFHGGANPFEEPLPTPIGRVEGTLSEMHAAISRIYAKVEDLDSRVKPAES